MRERVNWDVLRGQRQLRSRVRIRVSANKVPGPGRWNLLQVASIRLGLFHDNEGLYK